MERREEEIIQEISKIRERIDKIDEEIIRLIKERAELAREIAKIKIDRGLPIIDRNREEIVKKRWIEKAVSLGLPKEVIEPIVESLINYAIMIQVSRAVEEKWKDRLRVAIIGSGGMGRTMYTLFNIFGIETEIFSARRLIEENIVKLPEADIIIFATRPEYFDTQHFKSVLDNIKPSKVVMDILSVKVPTFYKIDKECLIRNIEYVSSHPLFGPTMFVLGESIILIRGSSCREETFSRIKELFSDMGLHVIMLDDPEKHDKYMSVVQVLHHFHQLSLMKSLEKCSKSLNVDISKICTKSLRMTLKVLERLREVIRAVIEIQMYNKFSRDIRRLVIDNMIKLNNCIEGTDSIDEVIKCIEDC